MAKSEAGTSRTVLIIAPDFAPSSMPPALRIRFLANHLAEFNWNPVVLTVHPKFYETGVDPVNEELVERTVEVVRSEAIPVRLTRKVGIGDLGLRSLWHLWRKAIEICRQRPVDLVFLSLPPYHTILLGRLLKRRFKIPYVVDYQDPWVIEDYWNLPKAQRPPKWGLAYAVSRRVEPVALKGVGHVVGVSEGTVEQVRRPYPWVGRDDVTAIPLGGETADFDYLRRHPRPNLIFSADDGSFHLTYTGVFIPAMHATARALFLAIARGLKTEPELFRRLRVHLVGTTYAPGGSTVRQAERLASEAGIAGAVSELTQRIPYLDALQLLLDSDALLAIGSDAPHYTASKIFPYLLAQKPILAVFHEASSVVSTLEETNAGVAVTYGGEVAPQDRVEEIQSALGKMLAGRMSTRPVSPSAFEPYSAREMARRLSAVLDRVARSHSKPAIMRR